MRPTIAIALLFVLPCMPQNRLTDEGRIRQVIATYAAAVQTDGRETQIYRKAGKRWLLVHVHYSAMAPAGRR